jgi:hypothetical protein
MKPLTESKWLNMVKQDLALLFAGAVFFVISFLSLGLLVVVTLLISIGCVATSVFDMCRLMSKTPIEDEQPPAA